MLRRDFIRSGALVAGSTLLAPLTVFANEEKIKMALLGTGWWGTEVLLPNILASGRYEIVALCDVDTAALQNAAAAVAKAGGPAPQLFADYRKMYALPGLEAVAIATPTHWHALQFIDACNRGLHVFLEKPISYDISEAQAMLAAHRKAGNAVLVDFPRTMNNTNSSVKQIIQSGEIGKVVQVQANIHNPEGVVAVTAVPETLDYEIFCGPAPLEPFVSESGQKKPNWRARHAFSRGVMADWGIHYLHNVRRILELDVPEGVQATGGTLRNFTQDNPDYLDVRYDFGKLPVHWSHKAWGYTSPIPDTNIGVFYYGDKGTLFAGDMGWALYPKEGAAKVEGEIIFNPGKPENMQAYMKMVVDMFNQLADGIRKRSNAGITNTFEEGMKTTAMVILGDMAFRTQAYLSVDPASLSIRNNKEAQAMLRREYRKPYVHPAGNSSKYKLAASRSLGNS